MVSPALLESNGIKAIDTEQLQEMLAQRTRSMHTTAEFLLVDVRSREGHEDGAIPGSMNIPLLELLDSMKERPASCLEEYVVEKYLQC
jgi:rhodanese-related sulfurtransferase